MAKKYVSTPIYLEVDFSQELGKTEDLVGGEVIPYQRGGESIRRAWDLADASEVEVTIRGGGETISSVFNAQGYAQVVLTLEPASYQVSSELQVGPIAIDPATRKTLGVWVSGGVAGRVYRLLFRGLTSANRRPVQHVRDVEVVEDLAILQR